MIMLKSRYFVLLPLGLLLGGCNLFLGLTPIPTDDEVGSSDAGTASDQEISDGSTVPDSDAGDTNSDVAQDVDIVEAQGRWRYVATGTYHSCAITKTGETYCWGRGDDYQLGNNSDASSALPVLVETRGFELKSLALSEDFSCGLDTDGELWCWGSFVNFGGIEYRTPTQLSQGPWKKIDASKTHACALSKDDELWCWGHNHSQQIVRKDGAEIEDQSEPAPCLLNENEAVVDIAVGRSFTCVLFPTSIECTGRAVDTDPSGTDNSEKSLVAVNFPTSRLEAGAYHVCALGDDGQAHCLGGAPYVTQFRESVDKKEFAKFQNAPNLTDLSAGDEFACAIDSDAHLVCWGNNHRGRLGRGIEINNYAPFAPGPTLSDSTYTQVSSTSEHACALTTDGNIDCWGLGTYGRIGDGQLGYTADPVAMLAERTFVEVELGIYHTCALQADGVVACWGRGFYQGLGNGSLDHQRDPVDVPGIDARLLAVGGFVGCAVNKNNSLACWGLDNDGLLGNSDRGSALLPDVQDNIPQEPIAGITVGHHNACYWLDLPDKSALNAYCWGRDSTLGTGGSGISPVFLNNHMSRADIRAGKDHVCAVNFSDVGICWGLNDYGQIGNGSNNPSGIVPIRPTTPPVNFRIIQAAANFSCGIDLNNKLWCWGAGGGRIGDGSYNERLVPTQSALQLDIKDLGGQGDSMCAITMTDELYCWGNNSRGEVGAGIFKPIITPTRVNLPEAVVDVDGEDAAMCAVGVSGKVYCWGDQTFYRAGDHVFGMKTVPTPIVDPI